MVLQCGVGVNKNVRVGGMSCSREFLRIYVKMNFYCFCLFKITASNHGFTLKT